MMRRLGLSKFQKKLKRQQKAFSKKKNKLSKRRARLRLRAARTHQKIANIRENKCHHISRHLVKSSAKVFVLEDLKTKNLSKTAKGSQEKSGKNVKAKSGLNREILNIGWHKIESQLQYKARKESKVVFKINPSYTSQECADCGHIRPENRSGIDFKCVSCGHVDHADINAAKVIKKRAINLILKSGTDLSNKGVLRPKDKGRGAKIRPLSGKPKEAQAQGSGTDRIRQKRRKASA